MLSVMSFTRTLNACMTSSAETVKFLDKNIVCAFTSQEMFQRIQIFVRLCRKFVLIRRRLPNFSSQVTISLMALQKQMNQLLNHDWTRTYYLHHVSDFQHWLPLPCHPSKLKNHSRCLSCAFLYH